MPCELSVPAAPDPLPEEIWSGTPNVVLDGERYAIGWQRFADQKGGPAYVTARHGIFGGRRVPARYPRTSFGWALACAAFAQLAADVAERTRVALGIMSATRSPAGVLAFLPGLVLGAIDPLAAGSAIGQAHDLWFSENDLQITRVGSREAIAEHRYADLAAVLVTGFERVLTASTMQLLFSPGWTRPDDLSAAAGEAERHTDWLAAEVSRLRSGLNTARSAIRISIC